jgi:thioredoxin 1
MSHPLEVSDGTFQVEVLESDLPVLVDFWAAWCAPCKMIAPIVEELAVELEGRLKVCKIDIDANPVSPGQFGVMSIPTLLLFRAGKAEKRFVGYRPKASLKNDLEAAVAV